MGKKHEVKVAIIGCGLGGITLAISLKKKLGLDTFTIYERASEPGGTWRDNIYPGCGSDIPSHEYQLSADRNPNWSKVYPGQPEIQAYWKGIYKKNKLDAHTQFDTTFDSAKWDAASQTWTIFLHRTSDPAKKQFSVVANVLVSCIGGFSKPLDAPPSLPGLNTFAGEKFHSAKWRYDIDLKNKRVAVIGNGCSATQFVPIIAQESSTKIVNFSRTPSWFFPRPQRTYSSFEKWAFANLPFVMKLYGYVMRYTLDSRFILWILNNAWARHAAEEYAIGHIVSTAPKKYHDYLIPSYPIGCKRVILDPGYLESLNRENVELNTDPIVKITEKGILGKSGTEYPFDVIILGTGFSVDATTLGLDIIGSNGRTLTDQWIKQGGPQAYLGTVAAGYPNAYIILGPNVVTGHASVTWSTESQVTFITKMIEPMIKNGVTSFELKGDAEDRYNKTLTSDLKGTVWAGGCTTYYKLDNGKIHVTYPGTLSSFEQATKQPVWSHFLQRGGNKRLVTSALRARLIKIVLSLAFLLRLQTWGYGKAFNISALLLIARNYNNIASAIKG